MQSSQSHSWYARLLTAMLASGFVLSAAAAEPNAASLADGCTSCHGLDGRSVGRIPALAGADRARLIAQLRAFRDQGPDATIMNRIARSYSDAEIDALAGYFSAVKR